MIIIEDSSKIAISTGENKISYSLLLQYIAGYSKLYNVELGDRVAIYGENSVNWIYAFYSSWTQGAIPIPIDALASIKDVSYILRDCAPRIVFCSSAKLESLNEALSHLDYMPLIFILDEIVVDASVEVATSMQVECMQNTAVIIYTSGTTGSPKGVMLSYENVWVNILGVSKDVVIFTPSDRVLVLLPIHHVFSLIGSVIAPLSVGAEIVFAKSMLGKDILEVLQKHKITMIIGVPRLYEELRKNIVAKIKGSKVASALFKLASRMKNPSVSRKIFKAVHDKFGGEIKYLIAGGAALNPEVARDFLALGFNILEGYGMTEASPMITFTRPWKQKIGSAGELLPATEIRFEEGEILAKGKNIMQGYYGREAETQEVIVDGWLHTGDLGYMDKEGYLFVTGRKKEIIVLSNGKNINPNEIEAEISNTHPIVREVGVFADGDALHAIFVLEEKLIDRTISLEKQVRDLVLTPYNNEASPYKKVLKMTISKEELPKTRLGKIQRFMLADFLVKKPDTIKKKATSACEASSEYKILYDYLLKEKNVSIDPAFNLEYDLSLDSLDKVALQSFVSSTFGVTISETDYASFEVMEDMCTYIAAHKTREEVEDIDWGTIIKESINTRLPSNWFGLALVSKLFTFLGRMIFHIKGTGEAFIPNEPCIIAPNHQSAIDGLLVSGFIRFSKLKNTFFYAKEKHFGNWILRFFAKTNNVIIVDTNKDLKNSIQQLAEALKRKKSVVIFPEGTRSMSGGLGDFKKMFAILSLELNVPIVPVTILGAHKNFKPVDVTFHEAIYPESNDSYESLTQKVRSIILKTLQRSSHISSI